MHKALLTLLCLYIHFTFSGNEIAGIQPKLHLCTVASYQDPGLNRLSDSCKFRNLPLNVLGMGQPYPGHGQKLLCVKEFVSQIPDHDVVLFVDGFDTLILADEKTIMERFQSFNAPFVIAAETCCFPFPHLGIHYPLSPTQFRYVNSGSYIGYAGYIKRLMEELSPIPADTDDQGLFTVYYLYHPQEFTLDYQTRMFLPLMLVSAEELKLDQTEKSVQYGAMGSKPCVVHGNGVKELYMSIYNQLFGKE